MAMNRNKLTAIDLFSGCGGLTTGLRKAGFQVVAAVEINPLATKTYKANHKGVLVWERNIKHLEPAELLERLNLKRGDIDLLAGCPPCQGFSMLRTLNGSMRIDDPRNDLLQDFQRFVKALRPGAIMMENVPPLADDERFLYFTNELKRLGYVGDHRILDAADYGVPQRRRRLIYLAGYGISIPFADKSRKHKSVKDVLSNLPKAGESGDVAHDMPENRSEKVMQIIRLIPKDGGSRTDLPQEFQLECHRRCNGFSDVYGRMAWNNVAPTITSGCFNPSKGRFLHPTEDRAITIREAALLQGFPVNYKFTSEAGKEALAEMIGNALPPPFITAHSRNIMKILQRKNARFHSELTHILE